MILARAPFALFVACLVVLAPACAKKKDSGSSSGKEEEEEEEDDLSDDGGTSTQKDTDPCDANLVDDEEESGDPCDGGDKEGMDPDSDFYAEFVTPPKMKDCNDDGFIYLRCTDECSTIKMPAKFKCDRAGIEAIFSTVQGAKEDLADYVDGKKYFIDQCGVTAANKPFVALACFTTGDGKTCVDKDALDSKEVTAEVHFLTTDTSATGLCPDP